MRTRATIWLGLGLTGCGPGVVNPTMAPVVSVPQALSPEQYAAINAASIRSGFAGSYRDGDVVTLAFDQRGMATAHDLTGPGVRAVEVRFNLIELDAAKARTVALIGGDRGYGSVGIDTDKRRNGVEVTSVILVSGNPGICSTRLPLPARDPINGVPIFDDRDC